MKNDQSDADLSAESLRSSLYNFHMENGMPYQSMSKGSMYLRLDSVVPVLFYYLAGGFPVTIANSTAAATGYFLPVSEVSHARKPQCERDQD